MVDWAIPVLGFIGTVLGLSEALAAFGGVLTGAGEVSEIANSLRGVTGGLSTAFETTLEALVAAMFIHLFASALRAAEQSFLENCSEYCIRNIVGRLRMMPLESEAD